MMKTLKYMAAAAIMAVLPMTANAAIVTSGDIASGDSVNIFDGPFSFQSDFTGDVGAGVFTFEFFNPTATRSTVAVTFATINQSIFGAFTGEVVTEWVLGGATNVTAAGDNDSFTLSTVIGAGASDTLQITFSAFDFKGANGDIDFVVGAVPLPASLLLFMSALGGVGLIARRRRQADLAA